MSIATETDKHNAILDLMEKIRNLDAQEEVVLMLKDGGERRGKILDIGVDHIYMSEGSNTTGHKMELDSIVGIDWIEKINQHLDLGNE